MRKPCPECDGLGYVWGQGDRFDDESQDCPTCGGKGYVEEDEPIIREPDSAA